MIVDQQGGRKDSLASVELFGRNFRLNTAPVFLALKYDVPLVSFHIFREEGGQHRIEIGPEIPIANTGQWEEDVRVNLQSIISNLEKTILKAPDHWWYWAWAGFQKDFKGRYLR